MKVFEHHLSSELHSLRDAAATMAFAERLLLLLQKTSAEV